MQQDKIDKKKGAYLLPNLLTTTGLFCGFYAIVSAMKGMFEYAAIALFVAMLFDGLDGRVARATGTQSLFGAEYDSLSDMVCFGLAPALLVYQWALSDLGKIGWLSAFIYTACTALRLARFNTQLNTTDKNYFVGIPCPPAAAVMMSMVWLGADYDFSGKKIGILIALLTFCLGCLMVSRVRYHSFKEINWKEKMPFLATLLLLCLISVLAWDPPKVLFLGSVTYALSGPLGWCRHKIRRKK